MEVCISPYRCIFFNKILSRGSTRCFTAFWTLFWHFIAFIIHFLWGRQKTFGFLLRVFNQTFDFTVVHSVWSIRRYYEFINWGASTIFFKILISRLNIGNNSTETWDSAGRKLLDLCVKPSLSDEISFRQWASELAQWQNGIFWSYV